MDAIGKRGPPSAPSLAPSSPPAPASPPPTPWRQSPVLLLWSLNYSLLLLMASPLSSFCSFSYLHFFCLRLYSWKFYKEVETEGRGLWPFQYCRCQPATFKMKIYFSMLIRLPTFVQTYWETNLYSGRPKEKQENSSEDEHIHHIHLINANFGFLIDWDSYCTFSEILKRVIRLSGYQDH